jgi:hypothetical protein
MSDIKNLTLNEKLVIIQSALKAPKGAYNSFGKYNYRSCEDILEALKPILLVNNCYLVIGDEIKLIGDRYYVEATAMITCGDSGKSIVAKASARENESQPGMNAAQITGSASSYSRKYALGGLFCIDDTKDADTQDNSSGEYVFTFGKHKGKLISAIDEDYLMWLGKADKTEESMKAIIRTELIKRKG